MDRWQRIQDAFSRLLETPPESRAAVLEQLSAGDREFRAEVESLLRHHETSGNGFLHPPPPPPEAVLDPIKPSSSASIDPPPSAAEDSSDPLIGQFIGDYLIKSGIAVGGMGTVYLAEQDQPRRLVALKLLRAGLMSTSALKRFEYEAEILARLRHPHVAAVYEAGTHLGLPFFAMEFIPDALSITDYAARHGLSTRQRLELFTQVCDAVQHGHQRGVIHRDLKPANILVDAAGQVKVIDFGVARSTDADVTLATMHTETGQIVGTLQYMSPEQCAADLHEIDTRSDVYSLGVTLYELLCGRLPYDVANATLATAARIICEHPPARPSSVTGKRKPGSMGLRPVSEAAGGSPATPGRVSVSPANPAIVPPLRGDHRGVPNPDYLPPVRGDLEHILLTALEKSPASRYQSAADLRRDIRHYLAGEPIEAKTPTIWTRAVRWAVRHPVWVTTGACVCIAVLSLLATKGAVWWYNEEPCRIDRYDAHGMVATADSPATEARLYARSGRVLNIWQAGEWGRIQSAELIEQPEEYGGESLVVLAFSFASDRYSFGNSVAAFDPDHGYDEPIWQGRLDENQPLPDPHKRGYQAFEFGSRILGVFDIFPDSDHPGAEIVVEHGHITYSQRVLRIYNLRGDVLYQIWQDGGVFECYWMSEPGLLAFTGQNGEGRWDEWGWRNLTWALKGTGEYGLPMQPFVLFAVHPVVGSVNDDYLGTRPGTGPCDPTWYYWLSPPELLWNDNWVTYMRLSPPKRSLLSRAVTVDLIFYGLREQHDLGGLAWELDEHGQEVPGTRLEIDHYKRNRNERDPNDPCRLPDSSLFQLRPWPPTPDSAE